MKPVQRFSYNIDAKRVDDKNYLLKHLKALNPATVGVMDGPDLAREIKALLPGAIVWHRWYGSGSEDEGQRWKQGDKAIDDILRRYQKDLGGSGIYCYVLNEPVEKDDSALRGLLAWLVRFMAKAKERGVHCVMGNLGTGVYELGQVQAGLFDDYLRAFADGYHIQGWHEYGGPFLPLSAAGRLSTDMLDKMLCQHARDDNKHWWPFPDDVQQHHWQSNFIIGRIMWWEKQEHHLGLKPGRKIISEFGWDQLDALKRGVHIYDALKKQYEFVDRLGRRSWPWPHITLRGWHTYKQVWEGTYDGQPGRNKWTHEQAAFEQLRWAHWVYPESVIGFNLFTWAKGGEWDTLYGFNYSEARELHGYLEDWTAELEKPTEPPAPPAIIDPTYPDLPGAADPRWKAARLRANGDLHEASVRARPKADATPMASIADGTLVDYIAEAHYAGYVPVKTPAFIGWVLNSPTRFEAIVSAPPSEPLPPIITPAQRDQLITLFVNLADDHAAAGEAYLSAWQHEKNISTIFRDIAEQLRGEAVG